MIYEDLDDKKYLNTSKGRIEILKLDSPYLGLAQYEVSLNMSGLKTLEERRREVVNAKSFIRKHALANMSKFSSILSDKANKSLKRDAAKKRRAP